MAFQLQWKTSVEELYDIAWASEHDLDAILDLQERNLPKSGGTLSAPKTFSPVSTNGQIQPAMDDRLIAKKHTYWESKGQVTRRLRVD